MTTINVNSLNMADLMSIKTQMQGKSEAVQEQTWGVTMKEVDNAINRLNGASEVGETDEDTQAGIEKDFAILDGFEDEYKNIVSEQADLEKECSDFQTPDLDSISSSSQAQKAIEKVDQQIARIKKLINIAKKAIETLNKEKETAEEQLEARQAQYNAISEEMNSLNEQISAKQKETQELVDDFASEQQARIDALVKEYESGDYQEKGITIEQFLAEKLGNITMPDAINQASKDSQDLYDQLTMKGAQLKLVGAAIDKLNDLIESINSRIEEQNTKLEDYNTNLNNAQTTKEGLQKIKAEYQKLEAAQRKKKKKWYRKIFNRIAKACRKAIKDTIKTIKRAVKNFGDCCGDVCKFAGKSIGHVVDKYIGLDNIGHGIEDAGEFMDGACQMVAALTTFDKDDIKESYKLMEDNLMSTLTTAVIVAGGAALGVGGTLVAYAAAETGVISAVGDIADDVLGELGHVVDKYMGLDSLGKGIQAIGEFTEGQLDMIEGEMTDDDSKYEDGKQNVNQNAMSAIATGAAIVASVMSGGALAGTAGLLVSNATSETVTRETGNQWIGAGAGFVAGNLTQGFVGGAQAAAKAGTDIMDGAIEGLQKTISYQVIAHPIDSATKAVEAVSDGASYIGGKIADGASYIGGKIADGASYVGGAIADGASYVGNAALELVTHPIDALCAAGNAIVDGVVYAGEAIADGAVYLGGAIADGAGYVADGVSSLFSSSTGDILSEGANSFTTAVSETAGVIADGASAFASGVVDVVAHPLESLATAGNVLLDGVEAVGTAIWNSAPTEAKIFGIGADVVATGGQIVTGGIKALKEKEA